MPRGYRVPPWAKGRPPWHPPNIPTMLAAGAPTPPPDTNRWLVSEYAHAWIDNSLFVACTTDIKCHLYLRWTATPSGMHNRATDLRGFYLGTDPKYCFVEYTQVEQNELGDTYSHTFNFPGWAHCIWRWWFLVGQVDDIWSPSASCIFSAHYLEYGRAESLRHIDLVEKEVAGVIDHADNSITADKLEHDLDGVPIGLDADLVDGKHASEIGNGGFWTIISSQIVSEVSQIAFPDIPAGLRVLKIIGSFYRTTEVGGILHVRFNEDAGANYYYAIVQLFTEYSSVTYGSQGRAAVGAISAEAYGIPIEILIANHAAHYKNFVSGTPYSTFNRVLYSGVWANQVDEISHIVLDTDAGQFSGTFSLLGHA